MKRGKYTALEVAKWFLNYVRQLNIDEDEEPITNLKLQKLLYYAQGSCLAILDKPLFDDPIVHWMHGPVVVSVYNTYSKYRGNPINYDETFDVVFDEETNALLISVYGTFGQYSAWGLRNMTHEEDPWKNTVSNQEISQESIKKYFIDHYVE